MRILRTPNEDYRALALAATETACAHPYTVRSVNGSSRDICLVQLNNCVALDFGIERDWSFTDFMISLGCDVYSFDPTIGLRTGVYGKRKFYAFGLSGATRNNTPIGPVKTLTDALLAVGLPANARINFLKFDVEGDEWDVFYEILAQRLRVDQMFAELHFHASGQGAPRTIAQKTQILRALLRHFTVWHRELIGRWNNQERIMSVGGRLYRSEYDISWLSNELAATHVL